MTLDHEIGLYPQPSETTPQTRDYLSPNRFKVSIARFPITEYFIQRLPLPSIDIGTTIKPTNTGYDYKIPGDKLEFSDLSLSFVVDENLQGMKEIVDWLYSVVEDQDETIFFSDITISLFTNNFTENKKMVFYNCYPSSLNGGALDVSDESDAPQTVDVLFKYSNYKIL